MTVLRTRFTVTQRTLHWLIPAARSAVYAVSFDRRTAEAKDYPRVAKEAPK